MSKLGKTVQAAALCAAMSVPAVVFAQQGGAGGAEQQRDGTEQRQPGRQQAQADVRGEAGLPALVQQLHQANQEEVRLGLLAAAKAESDDVASFAERMVTDHTQASLSVVQFARENKVRFTPGAEAGRASAAQPGQSGQMSQRSQGGAPVQPQELERLSGAVFDRAYMRTMVALHDRTLQTLRAARQNAANEDAQELLDTLTSTVEGHLEDARELSQQIQEKGTAGTGGAQSQRSEAEADR